MIEIDNKTDDDSSHLNFYYLLYILIVNGVFFSHRKWCETAVIKCNSSNRFKKIYIWKMLTLTSRMNLMYGCPIE